MVTYDQGIRARGYAGSVYICIYTDRSLFLSTFLLVGFRLLGLRGFSTLV